MALKTALQKIGVTYSPIASNPSESGIVLKVSSLFISNTSASQSVLVDVGVTRESELYSILKGGEIPAGRTLSVFVNKDVGVYLEEGDAITLKASAGSLLEAVCSYSEVDPTAICEPICLD